MSDRTINHNDLVTLTHWMAEHAYTSDEIAYAVEKPWKHLDLLRQAQTDTE